MCLAREEPKPIVRNHPIKMLYRQLLTQVVVVGYRKTNEGGYGAQVESALLRVLRITQFQGWQIYRTQLRKSLPQQHQTLSITSQYHLVPLSYILANQWNTSGGMTQSPVEWCDQYFHAETITSMPFSRKGAAIASISAAGTLDNVCRGVARSMT